MSKPYTLIMAQEVVTTRIAVSAPEGYDAVLVDAVPYHPHGKIDNRWPNGALVP